MRTVLHVFPTFALGGSQRRLAQIARGLGGWRHVIVPLDGDRGADAAMGEAERTYREVALAKSGGVSPANLRALGRVIREVSPDLLCTYNWGAIEAALANRLGPRIRHLHFEDGFGAEEADGPLRRRSLTRRLVLNASRTTVVVPSSGLRRMAEEAWRVPPARVAHVANGVDTSRFRPVATAGPPRVAYLGALRPEKNVGRLIGAADAAGAALDVWGDGPERATLEATAGPTVRFRGQTDAPERALATASVFALSSDTEQMPLTVLEAMAMGLPVLATDAGDTASMVAEENRPFVTPLGDEAAYRNALRRLVGDEAIRTRLGAANRAKAERDYALPIMLSAYEALFAGGPR